MASILTIIGVVLYLIGFFTMFMIILSTTVDFINTYQITTGTTPPLLGVFIQMILFCAVWPAIVVVALYNMTKKKKRNEEQE